MIYIATANARFAPIHHDEDYKDHTIGYFLDHYPYRYPIYLCVAEEKGLIPIVGQKDIIDKVKEYPLIRYQEFDIPIPRSQMNKIGSIPIHDTHIKICILYAVKNTFEPIFP